MPTATAADPSRGVLRAVGIGVALRCRGREDGSAVQGPGRPSPREDHQPAGRSPDPVCVCEFTGPLELSQPTVSATTSRSSCRSGCWTASSAAPGPTTGSTTTPSAAWPPPSTSREPPVDHPADRARRPARPGPGPLRGRRRRVTGGQDGCGCGLPADCGCDSGCCGGAASADSPEFGAERHALDRDQLPDTAVLASLGCGNPTAVRRAGRAEIVLDLGSGGGIDVLSARRVGPTGKAYGLDMTEEMLALARANAAEAGAGNVEFLKGQIEAIPLPAETIDVVISNCVINLSTDKPATFAETYRVLKPGGRICPPTWSPRTRSPEARAEAGRLGRLHRRRPLPSRVRGRTGRGWLRRHLGELHPPGRRRAALGHHQGHPPHRPAARHWVCHGPSRAAGQWSNPGCC